MSERERLKAVWRALRYHCHNYGWRSAEYLASRMESHQPPISLEEINEELNFLFQMGIVYARPGPGDPKAIWKPRTD